MASKMINRFLNADLEGEEKKYNNIKLLEILIAVVFIVFGIILILNKTVSDKFISMYSYFSRSYTKYLLSCYE